MSGVISAFGGLVDTTCFTDNDSQSDNILLVAVVIWRRPATASSGTGPRPPWQVPKGWSGVRGDDGREVLYHRQRRVVRVLEREYTLPPRGEALLVLIDEPAPGVSPPAVGVHTLAGAVHMRPAIDHTLAKPARLELIIAASRAEEATWNAAIAAHLAVQSFLAADSDEPNR